MASTGAVEQGPLVLYVESVDLPGSESIGPPGGSKIRLLLTPYHQWGNRDPGYDEGLDPNLLTEEPFVSFVGVCPGAVEGRRAALALFASRKGDG